VNGTVVHLYLTGAQAVTVALVADDTLVTAEVLGEPAGRPVARVIGPPGELWALVTALSEALVAITNDAHNGEPVTMVIEPLHIAGVEIIQLPGGE
jgi:hypothetical protein